MTRANAGVVEGTVRDLSRFGEGIVETTAGTVFAAGVLPGERVELTGVRKAGRVQRAGRARVLDPSAQRVEPRCPIQGQCGGCPLMIATPQLQARFKHGLVAKAIAPLDADLEVEWVATSADYGYRRRARVSWARDRRLRFGFFSPRTNAICDVERCVVLHPAIDAAFRFVRGQLGPMLQGEGEVHFALGRPERGVIALRSEAPQPPQLFAAVKDAVDEGSLAGAALRVGGASVDATFGDPVEVRVGGDGEPLLGTVAGFSQAHDAINHELVKRVRDLARPEGRTVLELFAGAGNLTVLLAAGASELLAIESDEAAAAACRANLKARSLEATVRAADAEAYRIRNNPDVVVLDPPRVGAPGAIREVVRARVPEVVYVSCDPPTLSRDLLSLRDGGYRATHVAGLDMFPQTAHLEVVVRLERIA